MSKELETIALWRDGGGGLWMGRDRPERPWNWLTGTDASPDDLLSGESRKVEESFGRIDPDDVRPTPDLPDRDPRNVLTDTWRVCVLSSCYRPVWREFSFRKSGRF